MTIKRYTESDLNERFGFVVKEVARLYSRRFDQLARQQLGLSLSQCRLIGELARHEGEVPLSQVKLADRLELTPMGVAGLCERMEAAGWIRRQPSATDRRANEVVLEPKAEAAMAAAMKLGDEVQAQALAALGEADRQRLMSLLQAVRANLSDSAPSRAEGAAVRKGRSS